MKRVLVIGDDSYIGQQFRQFAGSRYDISMVNSRGDAWQAVDFTGFDALLHCVGIAHQKRIKKDLYYEINCDLALHVAEKAKREGVPQFIFLSSMAVYGNKITAINLQTLPAPAAHDHYGGSKWEAENKLIKLINNDFLLCRVRPPMVYGAGCKGNYPRLVRLANGLPFFPDFPNRRSMIHIDNLSAFFCDLIDNKKQGIFLPQDDDYVCTASMVKKINPRIRGVRVFNPLIRLLRSRVGVLGKLFGDLYYEVE